MGEMTYFEKVRAKFSNSKAFLLILSLQFGSAGMYVITMDALNKGMSHYVFVVYRNVIATITLAPFAFFLERFNFPLFSSSHDHLAMHSKLTSIMHARMHACSTYNIHNTCVFNQSISSWTLYSSQSFAVLTFDHRCFCAG